MYLKEIRVGCVLLSQDIVWRRASVSTAVKPSGSAKEVSRMTDNKAVVGPGVSRCIFECPDTSLGAFSKFRKATSSLGHVRPSILTEKNSVPT